MRTLLRRVLIIAGIGLIASAAQAQTVLHLNEIEPNAGPEAAALASFKTDVEAATSGTVRIDLHFAASLGDPAASLENMMSGDLDLLSGDMRYFLPLMIDEVTGLDLPFMVPGNDAARRYLATPMFDEARGKVLDIRRIRFLETAAFRGPERVIAASRPIKSLDDLRGLKIAIFPGPTKSGTELWQALGVTVPDIAWSDVAIAVQQHRIDAVIAPDLPALVTAGITQAAPYVGSVRDHPQVWQIAIGEGDWQKLQPAQRDALTNAAADAAAVYGRTAEADAQHAAGSLDPGKDVTIGALAAHDRLFSAYNKLITEGATTPRVRDTAAAMITRPAGASPLPVPVGQEFQDCPNCPVMVVVPAGQFMMGSPPGEKGRFDNEGPQRTVVVSHPFAISKYTVTMGQLRAWQPGRGPDPVDNDPAVMVTWPDAGTYAGWLSANTGRHYRLPTEAEYEYAERANTTTRYYWGDTIGVNNANCFGCGSKWDGKGDAPVGSFAPNKFGLYDMTGNVFVWVQDCYFDSQDGAPTDAFVAREALDGSCASRVLRSSSWFNLPSFLRSAYRFHELPQAKNSRRSFRLVVD